MTHRLPPLSACRRFGAAGAALALTLLVGANAIDGASYPPIRGHGGAVASGERAATEAGLEILRSGGNAVDAAVAVALALAVVHPEAGNLGGGGFAVVKMDNELVTLDFRETAPARAHATMYLDQEGLPVPDASRIGPLAAAVPGSPTGLYELHRRFGAQSWQRVVDPARRLATDGFTVSSRLHRSLSKKQDLLARFAETAAVWLPKGKPPDAGTRMRLPSLGKSLAAYAEHGPKALTSGSVAAAIERISAKYGGVLQVSDLEDYRPVWREPVVFEAFDWTFASMDLPSSGGIILAQSLSLLEQLEWIDRPRFGADRAHLLAEVWRRSFADRFLLGDPATTQADSQSLLAAEWLELRRASISHDRATLSALVAQGPGPQPIESPDTTHLSVADAAGNLVALTTTLNRYFGSGLLVPEAGYLLNNQMDDFATAPGQPNLYGLIQGTANSVGPGKRMLSSMTPTIAWRGDEMIAVGGRGGSRIPTATAQVLLHLILDGDALQTAVNRPRIHHQWLPDLLSAESDALSPETAKILAQMGHQIVVDDRRARVAAVRLLADGTVEAAADPRGPGAAGVVKPIP